MFLVAHQYCNSNTQKITKKKQQKKLKGLNESDFLVTTGWKTLPNEFVMPMPNNFTTSNVWSIAYHGLVICPPLYLQNILLPFIFYTTKFFIHFGFAVGRKSAVHNEIFYLWKKRERETLVFECDRGRDHDDRFY